MLLERYFAVVFLVVSLSHIVQPKMWVELFAALRTTGHAAVAIAMFTLPQGLVIVIWHNVWVCDLPVVLTIVAWGMTIKSAGYLLNPKIADRMIEGPGASSRSYVAGWNHRSGHRRCARVPGVHSIGPRPRLSLSIRLGQVDQAP